ncbi:MAG: hypothetical protein WC393_04825 [Candidatus Nanoarchaeia archaeon]|jgi:hypothetical protein
MVFNDLVLKDAPGIAGIIVTKNYPDALSATIVDLLRRKYLTVKRIAPLEKNINNKYYHNYQYLLADKSWVGLMDFEKMLLELLKKYKGYFVINQEELEQNVTKDPEFKGFYKKWRESLNKELEQKGFFKKSFLGLIFSLTEEGRKKFNEYTSFKNELSLLKNNSLEYNNLDKWENYLCYSISFGSLNYAEKIWQLMDELFLSNKTISNIFIEGIKGNDAFFEDFNFFAPIDFGIVFRDFLVYRSK